MAGFSRAEGRIVAAFTSGGMGRGGRGWGRWGGKKEPLHALQEIEHGVGGEHGILGQNTGSMGRPGFGSQLSYLSDEWC